MRLANLALRFVLELAALAAYGVATFVLVGHAVLGWVLAIVAVVIVATLWGTFLAPNARRKLPVRYRIIAELTVFAGAVFLLSTIGAPVLAIVLAVLVIVNELLLLHWRQYAEIDAAVDAR